MAELHSRTLLNRLPAAMTRINDEQPRLQSIAKSTFDTVIRDRPELFLRADLAKEGVTLDVMTELYLPARQAGAITNPQVESAGQLFEYCRGRGIARGGWRFSRKEAQRDAQQLKYLMACLEEINRISGLRLLMTEIHERKIPITDVRQALGDWWKDKVGTPADTPDAVIAYAFA